MHSPRCKSIAVKSGKQCVKVAVHNGYCALHDPAKKAQRSEAGKRAALKRYGPGLRKRGHTVEANGSGGQFRDQFMGFILPMLNEEIDKRVERKIMDLFTRKS